MRARTFATAALLAATAACGGPVLFAELEMPSVEVTLPAFEFPAFVAGTVSTEVTFDIGANVPLVNDPDVDFDIELRKLVLLLRTATPGNFDGFQSVKLTAIHPSRDPARELVLLQWSSTGATGLTRVEATSQTDADLKPFLSAGNLTVRAEYAENGLFPVQLTPWTADLTADFWMKVRLDYGAALK
jgi:hypothetical protein